MDLVENMVELDTVLKTSFLGDNNHNEFKRWKKEMEQILKVLINLKMF
jgi:hypothetical protein